MSKIISYKLQWGFQMLPFLAVCYLGVSFGPWGGRYRTTIFKHVKNVDIWFYLCYLQQTSPNSRKHGKIIPLQIISSNSAKKKLIFGTFIAFTFSAVGMGTRNTLHYLYSITVRLVPFLCFSYLFLVRMVKPFFHPSAIVSSFHTFSLVSNNQINTIFRVY